MKGADRFSILLDSEPDRDRFDLDATLRAPADGLLPTMLGRRLPINLRIAGDGTWSKWRGKATADLSGKRSLSLALAADSGRYRLSGQAATGQIFKGKLLRLTSPLIDIKGEATLKDRLLDGELQLRSSALRAIAKGGVDLGANRYSNLTIGADLIRPPALFRQYDRSECPASRDPQWPIGTADYSYRLTSPKVAFDNIGFIDVRAEGRGRGSKWPVRVPIRLQARAVTGIGDVAGAILGNVRLDGTLDVTPNLVRGDNIALSSDKLRGKVSLMLDLKTGAFNILVSGE